MEIRIPLADEAKFLLHTTDMLSLNVKTVISRTHLMRNGFLSIQATLSPAYPSEHSKEFRKRGYNGRLVFAICHHGHYAWMKVLFQTIPFAKLKSVMTQRVGEAWMNKHNFERVADKIGYQNVGSIMEPRLASEACDC